MKKVFFICLIFVLNLYANEGLKIVSFDDTKKMFETKEALFIDARGANLFQKGTIPGALNIDAKEYSKFKHLLPADKNTTIVSFCNGIKCEHSDTLATAMQKDGFTNVVVYKGGYPEWQEKKMPQMGILKECKAEAQTAYVPKTPAVTIKGATIHLIKDDNKMIDQFWFATIVLKNMPKNVQLIDIRKPEQFAEGHLPNAINIPFKDGKIDETLLPTDKLNVIYCNTGMQSTDAITSIKNNDGSIIYFDANVDCKGNDCKVKPNDLL